MEFTQNKNIGDMCKFIPSLSDLKNKIDVFAFDQWGVLHDGEHPYKGAINCIKDLSQTSSKIYIITNSGKREKDNLSRIVKMGFENEWIDNIISSGETAWKAIESFNLPIKFNYPINCYTIARNQKDGLNWLKNNSGGIHVSNVLNADLILLLGIPDESKASDFNKILDQSFSKNIPLLCANPDLISPRHGGKLVISSGTIAQNYHEKGGIVLMFGKPYSPIFNDLFLLSKVKDKKRIAVIGDSLEHDILGGNQAGMTTVLVLSGIHNKDFLNSRSEESKRSILTKIVNGRQNYAPDFVVSNLN